MSNARSEEIFGSTKQERQNVSPLPNVTRRGFIQSSMALATGIALSCLDGSDVFSAVPAFAEEGNSQNANVSSAETKIVIVRPTQIGIVAYDVSNPDAPVAIPDCKVTIYSRYNKKTLNATTNAEGKIVLDISELAETDDSRKIGRAHV